MDVSRVIDICNGAHRWTEESRLNLNSISDEAVRTEARTALNGLVTLLNGVLALAEVVRQIEMPRQGAQHR